MRLAWRADHDMTALDHDGLVADAERRLARFDDEHLGVGMAMELGAFTPFLWFIKAREMVWDILEEETGARLTHSFGRIGGMANPPTPALKELCRGALPAILKLVEDGVFREEISYSYMLARRPENPTVSSAR